MEGSLFPREMLDAPELSLETIAGKLLTFTEQFHLIHWQTENYGEHQATGELYECLQSFRDELIEKMMGYTGRRPKTYEMGVINTSSESAIVELGTFAMQLRKYAERNDFVDIVAMAETLSGKAAKYKYLLTLT